MFIDFSIITLRLKKGYKCGAASTMMSVRNVLVAILLEGENLVWQMRPAGHNISSIYCRYIHVYKQSGQTGPSALILTSTNNNEE